MYEIQQLLQRTGLNPKESLIYLRCLELGGCTASTLSKKTLIPRGSVYDLTEKLIKKGYLKVTSRKGTTVFYATDPQEILVLLEDTIQLREKRKKMFSKYIPQLESTRKATYQMPEMRVYQGKDAIESTYAQVLNTTTVRTIYSHEVTDSFLDQGSAETIHRIHAEKGIDKKVLLVNTPQAHEHAATIRAIGHQTKVLPVGYPIHGDTIILDEKYLFVSYSEDVQVFEITHPVFVNTQKSSFDLIRKSC